MVKGYRISRIIFIIIFLGVASSARAMAGPAFTDYEARAKLREILQQPEFASYNLLTLWLEQLGEYLARLFGRSSSTKVDLTGFGVLEWVLFFAAILLVGFILIYGGLRLYRIFSPEHIQKQEKAQKSVVDEEQLRVQAEQMAGHGDFREAIRYLYLSLLLLLDKKELIRFRISKTNREYLREYQKSTQSDKLVRLVGLYERKWYGMEQCDDTDYREFHSLYTGLIEERS